MDKGVVDVKRGGGSSRFSSSSKRHVAKKSGMEDKDDEGLRFEKLKRERTKKLSILSTQSSSGEMEMMNSAGSDGEEQLRPTMSISKRFKLPKKSVHDCNSVDHSSVPRKLRSAMKKRSSEPLSPPSSTRKKPNHGMNRVELAGKGTMMKSEENRVDDSEGSPSQSIAGSISKDEEEVVETLSALAEMFPANDNMKRVDGEVAKAKPSILLSGKESSNPEVEAPGIGKDTKTPCTLPTSVAANSIFSRGSTEGTFKDKCSNELLQTDLSSCSNLLKELDNTIFQRKAQVMSLLSESEPVSGKPSCSHSQLSLREMQSKHLEPSYTGKPEIIVGQIAAFSRHELEPKDSKNRAEGPVLWPGLSSSGSHSVGIQGPSFKSNNRKLPSWLGMSPASTQIGSVDDGLAIVKDSGASVAGKKSWKRCSAHVYICRLIKVLEIGENRDRSCSLPNQSTADKELSSLLAGNSKNGVRSDLNGDVSAHNMAGSSAEKNPHEVRNAILLQRRLFQDHQQASTSSALHSSQNKGFDFLSLSAGGGGLGIPNRNTDKSGNGLEPSTQFHNPYLQSLGHNSSIMPFYLPHNQFSLPPSTDHHPAAAAAKQVRLQPKPYQYLGNRLLPMAHTSSNTESSHKQQQQQQQQQRNWTTVQMAGQYKPMGLPPSHNPNLQNGRQDLASLAAQYAKFGPQLLHSSSEALDPKYAPFFHQNQQQHHQHVAAIGSSSPAVTGAKRQFYLPSGYEGTGVRPYSDCPLPLQLLCNEHL